MNVNNEGKFSIRLRVLVHFLKHSFITTVDVIIGGWVDKKHYVNLRPFALPLGY